MEIKVPFWRRDEVTEDISNLENPGVRVSGIRWLAAGVGMSMETNVADTRLGRVMCVGWQVNGFRNQNWVTCHTLV